MSEYKFSCPHCDQHIAYTEVYFGRSINCPRCQQIIVIPTPAGVAAPPPSPPASRLASPPRAPVPPPVPAGGGRPSVAVPGTSRLAVASMVLSLSSLILGPLGFIPGIVCGHLAKKRLRRDPMLAGAGYAKAGLIVGYACLVLTGVYLAVLGLGVRKALKELGGMPPVASSSQSSGAESAGPPGGAPVGAAGPVPLSVEVSNFRPKGAGKKGGFTYAVGNRGGKPVTSWSIAMEYRDGDGVLEKSVPHSQTVAPPIAAGARKEFDQSDFFMAATTRSVSCAVEAVTFADGGKWSRREAALAAAAPGPLSFAGYDAPATVEVIHFRPNEAGKGRVAFRVDNRSNKTITGLGLEATYLDAAGVIVKAPPRGAERPADSVSLSQQFGRGTEIPPGGKYENDPFFKSFEADRISATARRVQIAVRSVTFAGGESWKATKKP